MIFFSIKRFQLSKFLWFLAAIMLITSCGVKTLPISPTPDNPYLEKSTEKPAADVPSPTPSATPTTKKKK